MGLLKFKVTGDFKKTYSFLERLLNFIQQGELDKYGRMGVEALEKATPVRTGLTAHSWYYEIEHDLYRRKIKINWLNSNTNFGTNIAVLIQYGHATGTGGYVLGVDYINPALKPVFEEIAIKSWGEIKRL